MKFIFDVDGVLCDRGQPIDDQFRWWLEEFLKDKEYYLVTGSPRHKTENQIGGELTLKSKIGYHCLGNSIWTENGREVVVNRFHFSDNEREFIKDQYDQVMFHRKQDWNEAIEMRPGSVNLSFVKRGASVEMRQGFVEFDNFYQTRINVIKQIKEYYPRFDCYLGGDCSIDIVLRGANKGQIFNWSFDPTVKHHFFGDRCDPHGIDQPLYDEVQRVGGEAFHIKEGYKETWEILKSLEIK